jgi:hypothetical protein
MPRKFKVTNLLAIAVNGRLSILVLSAESLKPGGFLQTQRGSAFPAFTTGGECNALELVAVFLTVANGIRKGRVFARYSGFKAFSVERASVWPQPRFQACIWDGSKVGGIGDVV